MVNSCSLGATDMSHMFAHTSYTSVARDRRGWSQAHQYTASHTYYQAHITNGDQNYIP